MSLERQLRVGAGLLVLTGAALGWLVHSATRPSPVVDLCGLPRILYARGFMDSPKPPTTDRAHDVLRSERQPLDAIFSPRNIAVIGATETAGSVGRTVLWNLIGNPFGGTVYPVNPRRPS